MSSRPSLPTLFPIVLKPAIEMRAAQSQDRVGSPDGPEHSRLFETRADDRLAASFDHPRANKKVLATKPGIAHPLSISFEVIGLGTNLLGHLGIAGVDGSQHAHQFFDFPFVQQALLVDLHPSFLLHFFLGIQLARHRPQMLPSMVEINNLNGPGKCSATRFHIHSAPSPMTTFFFAQLQPRWSASR